MQFPAQVLQMLAPIEVVDVEVKITSMQGMHIFRRDRTVQLIIHPMEHKSLPPPYYNQENKALPRGRKKNGSCTSAC